MSKLERELTEREQRALKLCLRFEEAIDKKQLTVRLFTNQETADALHKAEHLLNEFKVLSYQFDDKAGQFKVLWTLAEFDRYLRWVLNLAGLTLMMDGSLRTEDGLTLTVENLN